MSIVPSFRGVKNFAEIQQRFFDSARLIMLEHQIEYKGTAFDITELELYLKSYQQQEIWCDPAIDGNDEQYNSGTWYVRCKKGPRYWRIDFTAGCKVDGIQAGILIRQLNGKSGPAKALHSIILGKFKSTSWEPSEIAFLKEIHGSRIDGGDGGPLKICRRLTPLTASLYKGRRINIRADARNFEQLSTRESNLRVSLSPRLGGEII